MNAEDYKRWVHRLAQYEPDSEGFNDAYHAMIKEGIVHLADRVDIAKAARAAYEEERAALKFLDGYDDPWGPTGRYGGKLVDWVVQSRAGVSVDDLGEAVRDLTMFGSFIKFNTEGEKQMKKIDWHKPLRARNPETGRVQNEKVYTYKSGSQRVVWVEDRVYPVDDHGCMVATVQYPGWGLRTPGQKIVENVPEEKFFLGLYRLIGTRDYFLEDGCVMKTRDQIKLVEGSDQWIVDTRKSAEPPKAIKHDPKDYAVVYHGDEDESVACEGKLMTKVRAEDRSSGMGTVVRVRTTPAPVDTSRYIVLWREGQNQPWRIIKFGNGRQEFTWAEVGFRAGYRAGFPSAYCIVKVRD